MIEQIKTLAVIARRKPSDLVRTILEDHIKEATSRANLPAVIDSGKKEIATIEKGDATYPTRKKPAKR